MCLLLMAVILAAGAVDLDREGRDPAYVESIVKRSQKIVDKLELKDAEMAQHVTHIIANRYFKLNDIYEVRDAKVKQAKETLTGDAKQAAVKAAEDEKDAALYRCHFEFPAALSLYLDDKQIDAVKDGMTYGAVSPASVFSKACSSSVVCFCFSSFSGMVLSRDRRRCCFFSSVFNWSDSVRSWSSAVRIRYVKCFCC